MPITLKGIYLAILVPSFSLEGYILKKVFLSKVKSPLLCISGVYSMPK